MVDVRLADDSGLNVTCDLRQLDPSTVIVSVNRVTASITTAVRSIKLGAASHVTKPADANQIIAAFHTARSRRMKRLPSMESLRPGVVAYLVKRVLASHGVIERDRDTYALAPAFAFVSGGL